VSEQTVTNPSEPEVLDHEAYGSERPRRRTTGEIQDSLTAMLRGEYAEPQEEEQHSDSELEDGIEEEAIESESYEDSEEVDEDYDGSDEEQLESDSASYRVIVDGKEMQVPLDELISGYQRGSSFTQKSQALADERREFEANAVAVQQERESYSTVLQQLQQQMEAAAKPDLDWDRLERENPVQWLKLKQLERDRQAQIQAVREEQSRMQQVLNQQQEQDLENRLNTERTLVLEKIPEWADSEVQANEQRQLLEYGKQLGFTDSELNEIYDHRALIALRDAWRYNQLANGEKVKSAKSKIKNAKSGGKQMSRQMRGRKQRDQRAKLKETGKVDDAAALLGAMLTE
jgi:hypothetical protein